MIKALVDALTEPFALIFEHPDTPILLLKRDEDARYVKTVHNLEMSLTELMAVVKNMDKNDILSAEAKCAQLSLLAYAAEKKITAAVDLYKTTSCPAQQNKLQRDAIVSMMACQKYTDMFNATLKHVKMQYTLRQSRETFANSLATRISMFTHSQLGSAQEDHGAEFKNFLRNETKLMKMTDSFEEGLGALAKVSDYYTGGKNIAELIEEPPTSAGRLEDAFDRLVKADVERAPVAARKKHTDVGLAAA